MTQCWTRSVIYQNVYSFTSYISFQPKSQWPLASCQRGGSSFRAWYQNSKSTNQNYFVNLQIIFPDFSIYTKHRTSELVSLIANVYTWEQWMPQSNRLSHNLKASIYGRIVEYQVSCTELAVGVRINGRSQQSVQVRRVYQLSFLFKRKVLWKMNEQRLVI